MSALPSVTAKNPDVFAGFKPKTEISTLFLENNKHLLLLKRCVKESQSQTWGVPGGKKENVETPQQTMLRELKEETQIDIEPSAMTYHGRRYARIPGWDYIIHIFSASIEQRPQVITNAQEHSAFEWVSIYAFKLLPLIKGQDEVFDVVYSHRLWQRISPESPLADKTNAAALIVLKKGGKTLHFSTQRRLVLNLIGTSGSGKGTQGEMLSKVFGVPSISAGDLFRDEFRAKSDLGWMVQTFDVHHYPKYLPDEIPIGMMGKRLAEEDCRQGFILDGFPRTEGQGNATRAVFLRESDVHIPLFMDVPEEDIWARLPQRQICGDCGHQVRELDENPWPGFCPIDAAKGKMQKLEHRTEDIDKQKTERRLKMFRDNKEGILSSIAKRDPIATFALDNTIPPREVLHRLCEHIQSRLDQLEEKNHSPASQSDEERSLLPEALTTSFVASTAIANMGKS